MNTDMNGKMDTKIEFEMNMKPEADKELQQAYKREQQAIHVPAELLARTKAAMETESRRIAGEKKRRIRLYGGFGVAAAVCVVCLIALPYISGTVLDQGMLFGRGSALGKAESPMAGGAEAGTGTAAAADASDHGGSWAEASEAETSESEISEAEAEETGGAWEGASEAEAEEPEGIADAGADPISEEEPDTAPDHTLNADGAHGLVVLEEEPEDLIAEETVTIAGLQVHMGKNENGDWIALIQREDGKLVLAGPGMSKRAFVSAVGEYLRGE